MSSQTIVFLVSMMLYKKTIGVSLALLLTVIVISFSSSNEVTAFTAPVVVRNDYSNRGLLIGGLRGDSSLFSTKSEEEQQELLAAIRSMRVKELKVELEERKISTADAFEKEELVQRLYNARLTSPKPSTTSASATTKTSSTTSTRRSNNANNNDVLRGELSFVSMGSSGSISGTYQSESVELSAVEQSYPTMTITVEDGNNKFPLKLLVDTACSGLVLTPSAVRKHNLQPNSATQVTLTGASGMGAGGLQTTRIDKFSFGYDNPPTLGPLLAVVQDTGSLGPMGLDGIIGLSFLGQYACTEINMETSEISLYKTDYRPDFDEEDLEIVAEGELSPTRLGIWTVDMSLDLGTNEKNVAAKPIKMLVDTGSTSTILSWKGLQDGLGLSKSSPEVLAQNNMGALGSDNMAVSLTHKIEVERPIIFGRQRGASPHSGLAMDEKTIVDIGEVAVVDQQLAADNVGGILGMNVLSKAHMMRMVVTGPVPRLTLFQKKASRKNTTKNDANSKKSSNSGTTTSSSSDAKTMSNNINSASSPATVPPPKESKEEIVSPESSVPHSEETRPRKKKKKRRY